MEEKLSTKATDMVEKQDYENWDEIPETEFPTVKPVTSAAAPKPRAFVPSASITGPSITGCNPVSAVNLQSQLQGTNQIRILRRPTEQQPGSQGVGAPRNMQPSSNMSSQPTKSIAEREEEYLKARKRIFDTTGGHGTSTDPTAKPLDNSSSPTSSETDDKLGTAHPRTNQSEDRDETYKNLEQNLRHDDGVEDFETRESLSRNQTHHRINSEGRGGRHTMPPKSVSGHQFQPPQGPYPLSYSSQFVPVGYNNLMNAPPPRPQSPPSRPLSPPSVSNNSALLQNAPQRPHSPVGVQHYNMGHNPQHYGHVHSSQPLPYNAYSPQENSHNYHPNPSYGSQQPHNYLSHSGYIPHQNSYKQYVPSNPPHSSPIPNHFPHPHYNYGVPASSSLYSQFNANHGPATGPVGHKGKTKEENLAGNLVKSGSGTPTFTPQREFENGDSNSTRGKGNEGNYFPPGSNPQAFKPNSDMNGMGMVPGNLYIPPKGRNGTSAPRGGGSAVEMSRGGGGGRGRGRYNKPING